MTDRMKDLNHTHPDHDTRDWHYFRRGPAVAADGGRREAEERDAAEEDMSDVSHTPPDGDGANRVWDGTRVYERDADTGDDRERVHPRGGDDE